MILRRSYSRKPVSVLQASANRWYRGIDFELIDIEVLCQEDGLWMCGKYGAQNVILATGFETDLIDMRYMSIRGIWEIAAILRHI